MAKVDPQLGQIHSSSCASSSHLYRRAQVGGGRLSGGADLGACIPPGALMDSGMEMLRESQSKAVHGKKSKEGACQEHEKQTEIADLPRFELPEKASCDELITFLKKRFTRYEALKSFDICGMAVVTPPTDMVTYHIVDITRTFDGNPKKFKSILQLLTRETDNYIIGFRRTPENPTEKDGFFLYADVHIPDFFGKSYKMKCDSRYTCTNRIQIFDNMMTSMVESLLRVHVGNCNNFDNETRQMMETSMLILGECERMQAPLSFVMDNYTSESRVVLTGEVIMYMKNWSYLSKAIFAFYLGLLEVAMDVDGSKETYLKGRRSMAAAVKKFRDKDYILDLKDGEGFFSLGKLAGDCVRLAKYDETYVRKLIMRRSSKLKAKYGNIKHPRNDENDHRIHEESNNAEEEEWKFYKQKRENLIELLEQCGEQEKCDRWKRSYPRKVV